MVERVNLRPRQFFKFFFLFRFVSFVCSSGRSSTFVSIEYFLNQVKCIFGTICLRPFIVIWVKCLPLCSSLLFLPYSSSSFLPLLFLPSFRLSFLLPFLPSFFLPTLPPFLSFLLLSLPSFLPSLPIYCLPYFLPSFLPFLSPSLPHSVFPSTPPGPYFPYMESTHTNVT